MTNEQAIAKLKDIYENDIPNKNNHYTSIAWFDGNDSSKYCTDGEEEVMAMKKAVEALEKQIPKQPLRSGLCYDCPNCLETISHITKQGNIVKQNVCDCGQKILWD